MKKLLRSLLLIISFLLVAERGWGQITIASDGLNNSTTLFTLSGGAYYTGSSGTGDRPASSSYTFEGTHSRGVANGTATLTTSNINTSSYTAINMSFSLASFSVGSNGNGADAGDIVTVEVSPNGGTNWYSTIRVLGNNNACWGYTGGVGNASTAYDGNTTPVDLQPAGGGLRTSDGYGTVTITNLPSTTNLRLRITLLNDAANERWFVDNFIISGTLISTGPTNPTAQTLPYTQNFGTAAFSTYPAGFAGWNGLDGGAFNTQALAEASAPTGNATLTTQAAAFSSEPSGGLTGFATSSNGRLCISTSNNNGDGLNQPILAINTGAGNTSVTIAYDLEVLYSGSRTMGVVLQYRAGTTGSWTTVTNSAVSYPTNPILNSINGYSYTITGLNASTVYQFRWATWRNHGSGSTNTSIGLDNIVVTAGQPTLTEVFLPQFIQGINGTNNERTPYAYRATLSKLLPNATYRYYNQVVETTEGNSISGAGNCIFPGALQSNSFTLTTTPSLTTASSYGTFTTDASGNYTGWFITEPSGNARFTPGKDLLMRIVLSTSFSNNETNQYRVSTTNTAKVITYATTAGANNGSGLRVGVSSAAAKNFVLLFDNTAGTGRPIAGTFIESDGTANTTANNYVGFYNTNVNGTAGAWGVIIPNNNSNGVKRIEQRAFSDGALVNCIETSSNGTWPTGNINTVNPTAGATALALNAADVSFVCPAITTTSASYGSFCNATSNNISVAFTSTGSFTGNFFVQLSNASGVFPSNSTDNIISSGSTTSPITATIPSGQAAGTGYRVRVVNPTPAIQSGNDNGSNIVINAVTTPLVSIAITTGTNPTCNGASVTFTATPTNGGGSPTYQWKLNGNNIATGATYTTTSLATSDIVTCVMTTSSTCTTSPTATSSGITMTVNPVVNPSVSIAITTGSNPTCTGNTLILTATPTNGGATPTYQWKNGTTNIGTGATYSNSLIADGSEITCVMTSNATCATPTTFTSNAITITNNTPAQPSTISGSASIIPPQTVQSYSVTNVSGVTYAWSYSGTGVTIAGGQGTNAITLDFAINATSGTLTVTPSKAGCTGTARTLAINIVPANDNCSGAFELTVNADETCTSTTTGTLFNATSSIAATPCAGTANDDVWYKFSATNNIHVVTITPTNAWDVVVDVRSGACNGTSIKCADVYAASTSPEVVTLTGLTANSEYYVRVFSYNSTTPANPGFTVCVTTPNYCVYEDFEGTNPPASWIMNSVAYGGQNCSGSNGMIFNGAGDFAITPAITNPSTLTFNRRRSSDATAWSMKVQISTSPTGTWNDVVTISTIANASCTSETIDLSSYSGTQYIRFLDTRASGTQQRTLDDVTITCINCTPPSNPTGIIDIADNPACGTTTISYTATPPTDVLYYWQTTALGTSLTNDTDDDFDVSTTGTYYVRAYNTATQCWSDGSLASSTVNIINNTTTIAPSADQSINTGNNGSTLTVTEGSTPAGRKWRWSNTSGTGYVDFNPAQTNITYIPNFATAGEYYIICESTYASPCLEQQSNEVKITVIPPGPPVINHTSLGNTTATSNRTLSATITSSTAYTCTPFITYRINGGSWANANGTNTSGNNWSFTIPGQSTNTQIEYFITACNSAATVTSPANVNTGSTYGVFNEYTINCVAANSGTKTIAFQGFEFVSSAGYTFSVDNSNATPTGAQNYPAHGNVTEWRYYNQGANGSLTATNRNSCGCMAETFSGFPACPNTLNPIYTAGGSTGICRTFSGNSRGVYINTSAAQENPANSRSRNGNYAYIQQSRNDGGDGPYSFIYFNDVEIPDAANATNIKVIAYVSSISTGTLSNGAESSDNVTLSVKYNSNGNENAMVNDLTCGSEWFLYTSSASGTVAGTTNSRWDYSGNTYNTSGTASGTTTNNKIVINVPDGTTNVRAMLRILNDDAGNTELWAVDDIQIIADYAEEPIATGRYFRTKQNGRWESVATWESATTLNGPYQPSCVIPDYLNSDTIIISNTDTVRITADVIVDQTSVSFGGKLILSNGADLTVNNQTNSTDLLISGVYEDNATTPYGIDFINNATWKLNSNAIVIKTSSSTVLEYKDNFEGGIATIPDDAQWYYRYNGNGNPSTLAAGMFYPNLYFENITNTSNFLFNTSLMSLTGSTGGFCTVKGSLNIGTTGTGSVTVYNNNINSQPMLINGNITIANNSTLTNVLCPNCGAADAGKNTGTGFEVLGNLTVNGTLDIDSSTTGGVLLFSGTGTQNINGTGIIDVWNVEIDKQVNTTVNVQNDVKVNKLTNIKVGALNIESNKNYESKKVVLSTANSKLDIKANAVMRVNP